MKAAGVPITPGSDGVLPDADAALALAQEMGYPVLMKAVAGGVVKACALRVMMRS